MKFADLHLHTVFSDGTLTPQELIKEAAKASLSAVAVADHDTVDAIEQAAEEADKCGIEVLPAIELSVEYEGREVHILGYCIDYKDKSFLKVLEGLKANRLERIDKIVHKLQDLGVAIETKDVLSMAGKGIISRLHIAKALVQKKAVLNIPEAFGRYIGDGGPAHVLNFRFSVEEAIKLINGVGGVAVLAHPYLIGSNEIINRFISYGLRGIEAYYPEHSVSMVNFYLDFAKKNNLLVTGGSDFHGSVKPDIKVGCVKIPYELVEKIKEASN